MNRDYDTDIRVTPVELCSSPITRERTREILERLQISLYDSLGCPRSTTELFNDLQRVSVGMSSFTATRMAMEAQDAIIKLKLANPDLNLADIENTDELDAFLGTFKIVQGGVSL